MDRTLRVKTLMENIGGFEFMDGQENIRTASNRSYKSRDDSSCSRLAETEQRYKNVMVEAGL